MKIYILLLLLLFCGNFKAQNNIDVVFNETQINEALKVITSARAFNIGDIQNRYLPHYWYLNLEDASIDILPNNRIRINPITISGGAEIDLWLLSLTPSGNITGYLEGKFEVRGDNVNGYYLHIIFDRKPVLIYNGPLQTIVNLAIAIANNFTTILPNININLGYSILPDLLLKYLKSGVPDITTNNDEIILSFKVLFDDICVRNRIIKSDETITYLASNSITLKSGFMVENGANFLAKIEAKDSNRLLQKENDIENNDGIIMNIGDTIISSVELDSLPSLQSYSNKQNSATNIQDGISNEGLIFQQNTPNPFSEETVINCFIPDNTISSLIQINSILGGIVKKIPISQKGDNQIIINGRELGSGIYIYSLIIDGKRIDTKRMIVE